MVFTCATCTVTLIGVFRSGDHDESDGAAAGPASLSAAPPVGSVLANVLAAAAAIGSPAAAPAHAPLAVNPLAVNPLMNQLGMFAY